MQHFQVTRPRSSPPHPNQCAPLGLWLWPCPVTRCPREPEKGSVESKGREHRTQVCPPCGCPEGLSADKQLNSLAMQDRNSEAGPPLPSESCLAVSTGVEPQAQPKGSQTEAGTERQTDIQRQRYTTTQR